MDSIASSAPVSSARRDAAGLGVLEHRGDRPAVLALQPVQQREPLLDLVEETVPPAQRVDALGVVAQLVDDVVGLQGDRAHAGGELVQLRVHAADGLQRLCGDRQRTGGSAVLFAAVQRADAGCHRAAQRLDVAQPAALGL